MLRVIQWGTGVTGKHVTRAVHKNPDIELVACYTMSEEKNGKDVGEICGIGPIGVKATMDKEAIFATPADCVLYMTLEEFGLDGPVEDICRILKSGKNVLSTATTVLIYPKAAGPEVVAKIEAACREGGATFHGTGIHPGWAGDVLPLTLSGVLGRVDSLLIQEIMDYGTYPAPVAMLELMQFGKPGHAVPPTKLDPVKVGSFGAPLLMIADALGAKIDEVIFELEPAIAEAGYETAVGRIEAGTVSGKRMSFTAMIEGKPKIKIEHVTRMGPHVRPDWPKGRGWYVTAQGAPSFKLSAEVAIDGTDPNDQACTAAAMHVIHTLPLVCKAPPGIQTLIDLPTIIGKGVLTGDGVVG
jgi:hypothetical protein